MAWEIVNANFVHTAERACVCVLLSCCWGPLAREKNTTHSSDERRSFECKLLEFFFALLQRQERRDENEI